MTPRHLFPLLLVAVATAVLGPERAAAQCWYCGTCPFDPEVADPGICIGYTTYPIGFTNCRHGEKVCDCEAENFGFCFRPRDAAATAAEAAQLEETLAAIRSGRPIPADGPFFYGRHGEDFVVRRKCDAVEMARVAVADVGTRPHVAAG